MKGFPTPLSADQSDEPLPHAQDQFREAQTLIKEESYDEKLRRIRTAVEKKFSDPPVMCGSPYDSSGPCPPRLTAWVESDGVFENTVVFRKGDQLYKVDFELKGKEVVLGKKVVKVKPAFVESGDASDDFESEDED